MDILYQRDVTGFVSLVGNPNIAIPDIDFLPKDVFSNSFIETTADNTNNFNESSFPIPKTPSTNISTNDYSNNNNPGNPPPQDHQGMLLDTVIEELLLCDHETYQDTSGHFFNSLIYLHLVTFYDLYWQN